MTTIIENLENTKLGLVLTIMFIMQYALVTSMLLTGFYKKRKKVLILNLIPYYWVFLLAYTICESFYETTILRKHKN